MNLAELKARFPHATESFLRHNADDHPERVSAADAKPHEGNALEQPASGEEARWHGTANRFEITYTIYSVRPADFDNYSCKYVQDFLVKAGILPNDGWRCLSGRVISRKAKTQAEERTEIEIRVI